MFAMIRSRGSRKLPRGAYPGPGLAAPRPAQHMGHGRVRASLVHAIVAANAAGAVAAADPYARRLVRRMLLLLAMPAALAAPRAGVVPGAGAAAATGQEALVLSGGGARGLAHAGVVAGLDSLGIEPAIVTGASMGAIIGALYASGRDPAEIRALMQRRDWMRLFAPGAVFIGPDAAPLHPLLRWPMGTRRPGLEQGLVPDRGINREMVRLLFDAQVRARGDFDRFPRRYRVVTTDLSTGSSLVLGRGDLARLVRGSMAVPGAFAPVEWRGRWLVDGGIADNLPIQVARDLGATTVIAVDVIRPSPSLEGLTMVDLGTRALRLLILNTAPDSVRADFLVLPDIPQGMSAASFPRDAGPLIRLGLRATLATLGPAASALRSGAPAWRALPPPPAGFAGVDVHAPEPGIAGMARDALAGAVRGPYDPDAVFAAADALYASGLVDAVWAYVDPSDPSADAPRPRLRVDVTPAPVTTLLGSAGYDTDRGGRVWAGVRHRLASMAPAELTAAAAVQELEQWITGSARLVLPRAPRVDLEVGGFGRITDVRRFGPGGAIAGEQRVRRAGGRVGLGYRRVSPEVRALAEARVEWVREDGGGEGVVWGPRLELGDAGAAIDPVGVPALVEMEARAGAFRYARARARGSLRDQVGPLRVAALADLTWVGDLPGGGSPSGGAGGQTGAAAGGHAAVDAWPALGGGDGVPGLRWGERRAPAVLVAGLDVACPVALEGFLRFQLRAGAAAERPSGWTGDAWIGGVRAGLVWSTPFGPLGGGLGYATSGDWRVDVGIGPSF